MDPLSPHVTRALWYVDVLNARGVAVTPHELDRFAITEPPRASIRQLWKYGAAFEVLGEVREAEPVAGYMFAMGWIRGDDRGVELTTKGRAVLSAGADEGQLKQVAEPVVTDIELNPQDPLVFTTLTRRFAEAGAGMLVDPYIKADMLGWLTEATSLSRILISKKENRERSLIAVALDTLPRGNTIEVRATDSPDLHDRCLIAEDGTVRLLGASVTGIGKNQTAIITPDAAIMNAYRTRYESLWKSAERVEPQPVRAAPPAAN
ncbi:hypothetical protein [Catenulispora subtropica]|uniref:hypothetical protein n=1 Tax=Catenulispora subtropica TaxID=450798 RepID=UPI0031E1267E